MLDTQLRYETSLSLISILNNDQTGAFLWLGLALLVDGIDGTLARRVGVEEKAPNLDGIILDSIVDLSLIHI